MNDLAVQLNGIYSRVTAIPRARLDRMVGLAVGLPTWTVLGISSWLTPSPAGYGTHMELGLGGCTMLTLTGWPCPMCGMTTTFALMADGRVVDAMFNQPFGVVLFSLTALAGLASAADVMFASGWLRRGLAFLQRREQVYALLLLVGMIAGWLYKCSLLHPEVFAGRG
jgi:hypothetical protein